VASTSPTPAGQRQSQTGSMWALPIMCTVIMGRLYSAPGCLPTPTARDTLPPDMDLVKLLADIRGVRIAVIGDFCLDAYWTLDASLSETSIETGLPTRPVRSQRYSLGGAGNVVSNLVAMGVRRVSAFGLVGSDPFGREMLRILQGLGVETRAVLTQEEGWSTPAYIKPVEGESEQGRIDFGNANGMDPSLGRELLAALRAALDSLDLVVVN
jgi:bifunctional ADP-heptose synthase (sugar kinase/adenylyltransferase)